MRTILQRFFIVLAIALPVATLSSYRPPSILFYLLVLVGLLLLRQPACDAAASGARDNRIVFLLSLMPVLAVLVSSAVHGKLAGTELEGALRYALGLPLFVTAMLRIPYPQRWHMTYGIYGAIIAGLIYTLWLIWPDLDKRAETDFLIPVSYGAILMLATAISLYAIHRHSSRPLAVIALLALAAIGFFAAQLTHSRTGWLAVPLFLLIGIFLFMRQQKPGRLLAAGLAGLVILAAVGASSQTLRDRVALGMEELQMCFDTSTPIDNSVCARLQMWRAAWDIFQKNPVVGIGDGGKFSELMQRDYVPAGIVSELVATNFGEPHNDMLHKLFSFGILGGLGLFLMYAAPAWLFLKRMGARHSRDARTAAAMGAAVCLGFACFGLTEMMFRNMRVIGLYALLVAMFMALSHPRASTDYGKA